MNILDSMANIISFVTKHENMKESSNVSNSYTLLHKIAAVASESSIKYKQSTCVG